jgi:cell wall assembly regulator SMI1
MGLQAVGGSRMSSVEQVWVRLLDELATRAPGTRAAVRAPVRRSSAVADRLGIDLTAEVREWFALHDGVAPFFDGQVLPFNSVLSLPAAVDSVLLTRSIWWAHELVDHAVKDREPAGTIAGTWLASYVYVGQDGMGGGLFADLRRGPSHGCIRFWDKVDADDSWLVAASITDLLAAVHSAITAGGGNIGGWTPTVVDGVIDWTPADG